VKRGCRSFGAVISKIIKINFENVVVLRCGMANFPQPHAILSRRFELG
jgi:hypothetical protein